MTTDPVRTRRWTRVEYERLVELGVLGEDEPLVDAVVEVHRGPIPHASSEFGWRYGAVETFRPGAFIAPLSRPDIAVAVADLLP